MPRMWQQCSDAVRLPGVILPLSFLYLGSVASYALHTPLVFTVFKTSSVFHEFVMKAMQ